MCLGTCALCRSENVQLRRSHILSRFGHRRLVNNLAANPHPLQISPGQVVQTGRQITEHLLCHDCEQLLANGCEAYVANVSYQQNGDCRLYSLLGYTSTVTPQNVQTPGASHVAQCDTLNVGYLIDFAVSIFWRTAVSHHPQTEDFGLSPELCERLRSYLLQHGNELDGIPLTLQVIDQPRGLAAPRFDQVIVVPSTNDQANYRVHGFLFSGLYFTMWEGAVPHEVAMASLNLANPPHIAFSRAANFQFVYDLVALVNTTNWP